MRKRIMLFAGMIVLMAAGCQKNPDSSIVVNKDMDKLIEEAQKNDENQVNISDIAKNYDTYQTTLEDETLGVKVTVDAKVDIPQTDRMSVIRVKQTDITQEFLDKVRAQLIGDAALYDGSILETETRSTIEAQINSIKTEMASFSGEYTGEDLKNMQAEYQKIIDELQGRYENAPAEPAWNENLSDGLLHSTVQLDNESNHNEFYSWVLNLNKNGEVFYGVNDGGSGKYMSLFVQNNDNYGNCIRFRSSKHGYIFTAAALVGNSSLDNIRPELWNAEVTKEALEINKGYGYEYSLGEFTDEAATITQEEAQGIAEQFLENVGLTDFGFYKGGLYCEYQDIRYGADSEEMGYNTVYVLQYTRKIDGALVTTEGGSKHSEGWNGNDYVKNDWPIECIEFRVNDDGIIGFDYNAPLELVETVVENSNLKTFEEVKDTFEKMVLVTNASDDGKTIINIDRVMLNYARVSEANSYDTGLLVPVWDFMGTVTNELGEENYECVMTINAIDGSIIDRTLGY